MTEPEINDDVETEEFADELSDEALDREQEEGKFHCFCRCR
jgi:DNA-dependent RNA polymerase auxiliary subunit epsilon